jgi:hypothetical protein
MPSHPPPAPKSSNSSLWQTLLALLVVAFVLVGVALLVRIAWRSLLDLENQVAAAIVAGSTTVLVSVLSVTAARYWERRNERERELRIKKVPVYERFIGDWLNLMLNSKDVGLDETAAKQFFSALTPQLTIWASDDVVGSWSRLRREWAQLGGDAADARDPTELIFEFESLLFEIRHDLGHSNKGLKPGDLLGLWVNDIHEYVPRLRSTSRVA